MCTADQMFLKRMEDATVHVQLIHFNPNPAMVKLHDIKAHTNKYHELSVHNSYEK